MQLITIMSLLSIIMNVFRKESVAVRERGFPLDELPEEILLGVFCFLQVKDLGRCCMVCRKWKNIVTSQTLWRIKCELKRKLVPAITFENIPANYYRNIYLKSPYGRNLVKNPCGTAGLKDWNITESGGEGWRVENPPQGSDPIPDTDIQCCFATSYGLSEKVQIIDLIQEGLHPEVLDNALLDIEISELHAARFDCGSIYSMQVKLKDINGKVLEEFDSGELEEPQWAGKEWSQEKHVFSQYKPGVRYIEFIHSGQDTQYWAGHYGSKLTCATVKFIEPS